MITLMDVLAFCCIVLVVLYGLWCVVRLMDRGRRP